MTLSASSPLLSLPPDVRAKIYKLAGLARPCPIDLSEWATRSATVPVDTLFRCWRRNMAHKPEWRLCRCAPLPVALLRVCRRVHAEAITVLYGQNRFAIRARVRRPELLDPLLHMPAAGIAHMTGLLVRLNCWPCPRGHEEVMQSPEDGRRGSCSFCDSDGADADPVLTLQDGEMLVAWARLCAHLATSLRQASAPGQLDLTLMCDVDGVATARRLVEPMKQLPRLQSCTMRLGRKRDDRLSRVAREAALALTGETADEKNPFPFRELAAELRTRILEFTHLGSPEMAGYEAPSRDIEIVQGRMMSTMEVDSVFGTRCCNKCTQTYIDCCCPTYHASVAPHCTCRLLPTELFFVDRLMHDEAALQLFYPRNLFSFRNSHFAQTLDTMKNLTPAAARSIRQLRFVVTYSQFDGWVPHAVLEAGADGIREWSERTGRAVAATESGPSSREAHDWRTLVAFIGEHMDLPKLSITVDMAGCVWNQLEDYLMLDDFDPMEAFRHAYDMYIDIATPMCALKSLGKVEFWLGAFDQLAPWLEREVLGDRFTGIVEVEEGTGGDGDRRRRIRREQMIPTYHDVNKRLEGSNYTPQGGKQ